MPKQTRWTIKQRLGYALKDIQNAQAILVEEGSRFESIHPKHYEAFCTVVALLEQAHSVTTKLDEII